jgi:hypothetical protein
VNFSAVTYSLVNGIDTLNDNLAPAKVLFTPTVLGATTAGTATYTNQTGYYVKAGKLINFYIRVTWSGHTGTGGMRVGTLPVSADGNDIPTMIFASGIAISAGVVLQGLIYGNMIRFYTIQNGIVSLFALPAAGDVYLNGSYVTA